MMLTVTFPSTRDTCDAAKAVALAAEGDADDGAVGEDEIRSASCVHAHINTGRLIAKIKRTNIVIYSFHGASWRRARSLPDVPPARAALARATPPHHRVASRWVPSPAAGIAYRRQAVAILMRGGDPC
jgi:hypothetical protein